MLAGALVYDLVVGELPAKAHPVVWVGRLIARLEGLAPRNAGAQLLYGATMLVFGLVAVVYPAWLGLEWLRANFLPGYFIAGTLLLKSTFAVRGLLSAAEAVRRPLAAGRLAEARHELRSLVSRDTATLDEPLLAAAAVESVAENSSDSFVAPLFYFALFGVPGALAYRVANTYDSMIGYRGKYEYLGKAPARFDDLLNLIPARLTGLLLVAASYLRRAAGGDAWQAMWRYHGATESPNAGWPMSAMAGALGVRLEKVGHYRLGGGDAALSPESIARANAIAGLALGLAAALAVAVLLVRYAYFT